MANKNTYWNVLEKRFGEADQTVTERFGKDYFNGVEGWQFPEEKLKEANRDGQLLTMDVDFPGDVCKLNCPYCFAKVGEKTGTYYRPDKGDKSLEIDEVKGYVKEARGMGLESVKIIGYREPFDNPGIYDFIDFLSGQDIHTVIFTAGYTLGEKEFGGNTGKAIDFLAERPVSLLLKMHVLDRKTENKLVGLGNHQMKHPKLGRKGYSEIRDMYMKALLDDGRFNSEARTRLGIENVISSKNIEELLAMYEYFKIYRNVFVDLDPPIPVGRTGTLEEAEKAGLMPQRKLKELCCKVYRKNQKHGITFNGVSQFFGADRCSQLPNGLYLTLSGKVLTCCGGDEEIGDTRKEKSLKEIFEKNPYRKGKESDTHHICPYRSKKGIMTTYFIREVEDSLNKKAI